MDTGAQNIRAAFEHAVGGVVNHCNHATRVEAEHEDNDRDVCMQQVQEQRRQLVVEMLLQRKQEEEEEEEERNKEEG